MFQVICLRLSKTSGFHTAVPQIAVHTDHVLLFQQRFRLFPGLNRPVIFPHHSEADTDIVVCIHILRLQAQCLLKIMHCPAVIGAGHVKQSPLHIVICLRLQLNLPVRIDKRFPVKGRVFLLLQKIPVDFRQLAVRPPVFRVNLQGLFQIGSRLLHLSKTMETLPDTEHDHIPLGKRRLAGHKYLQCLLIFFQFI